MATSRRERIDELQRALRAEKTEAVRIGKGFGD